MSVNKTRTILLIDVVNELDKLEGGICTTKHVRVELDQSYKCSDKKMGMYIIHYHYPLHLIHLGMDLIRIEQILGLTRKDEITSFSDWKKQLAVKIKEYPLIKNKWKESRFKIMYNSGLTVADAFRCWYCAH